jgi:predicted LPLAT superfamily acyltransferase
MQPEWLRYRERGSVTAYRLIAWIARVLGRPLTRLLLYPICLYYILCSRTTRNASRSYLAKVFERAPRWREVFRHHYYFAATLLDRVYFYGDRLNIFDARQQGMEMVQKLISSGRGCLMLSAHMGSYEFVRYFGVRHHFTINMMMYEQNAQKIGAITDGLDRQQERRIIPIGPVGALLTAKERLDSGELVGMLGDRLVSHDRVVRARFFGHEASFPAGPFLAAAALDVPMTLFVCLYRGGNRYELYFEQLAERVVLKRGDNTVLQQCVQRYAERLEHYCRMEPYNWFNFYDFWGETQQPPSTPQKT